MASYPTEPGYYWAKLKTPSDGTIYIEGKAHRWSAEAEGLTSNEWEIVELNDNHGEGDEEFSVQVFGIPVTQWPLDFFWGPKVTDKGPAA